MVLIHNHIPSQWMCSFFLVEPITESHRKIISHEGYKETIIMCKTRYNIYQPNTCENRLSKNLLFMAVQSGWLAL